MKSNTRESKEELFSTMIAAFEELYGKKLDPASVRVWREILYPYPEEYFIRVLELAGELNYFPRVKDILEKFGEYDEANNGKYLEISAPRMSKEKTAKWIKQIKTILSYGGLLREDFDDILLTKLYEPEELVGLLNRNLKEGARPPEIEEIQEETTNG